MSSKQRGKVVELLQLHMRSCSLFCCLPYRFNESTGFHLTESKWELVLWKLNALACLFWAVFAVGRMIQVNLDDSVPVSVKLYMRLITPVICIPFAGLQFPAWKSGHHVVNLAIQTEKLFGSGKCVELAAARFREFKFQD